jgi:phosphatidylglycerophosphate synthase
MADYQPGARRPIADIFRTTAHLATRWSVRSGIHPDTISYSSMIAAAAAAICFWRAGTSPVFLIVSPLFCYLRLWLNMLDGMVAVASGKASVRGEILNDLPDRASDVVIFVGVAHSGLMHPLIGYWASIFAVLTAYVGLFGQAAAGRREFGGVMSKPWRMVALHLGAWITAMVWWINTGVVTFGTLTILDWTCLLVIAGCVQTIGLRLRRIMVSLQHR